MPAVALGSQFIVNAYTAFKQYRPFLTALSTGGFVVGWQDESETGVPVGSQDDVRFARYDGFGARQTPGGTDTLANTTTPSAQFEGASAGFADGKYVMVWTDSSETAPDFDNRAVRGQVFNANGTKSGLEFIVNSTFTDSQTQPSVTVLNSGRFAVTWTSGIAGDSGATNIISRVFNTDGTPFTAETTVNTQTVGNQEKSTVQALSSGGYAVVWSDREESPVTGDQTKTFIRFFSPGGSALGTPVLANSTAAGDPQDIDIAELTDGRIVITYADYETATSDGSGAAVRARIYNPVTSTFAPTINVNTTISNDQLDAQVAALDNGQFVVVWTDASTSGGDLSFTAVRMQVFTSTGAKSGGEVLVASTTTFEQQNPVVTVLKDFRFVVAWEDNSQTGADTEGFSIRSRIYDARIAGLDLDGGAAADNYLGSNFSDTLNGLGGTDILKGGNGGDFLFGGVGIDTLFGEAGDDELDGGNDNDTVDGGANSDTLKGGGGDDDLLGGTGDDFLYTDAGADFLDGGDGYDTIVFHKAMVLDFQNGVLDPDILNDTWIRHEAFQGSSGDDVIRMADIFAVLDLNGGGGKDTLAASFNVAYANTLRGEDGDDILIGGAGADALIGGAGSDTASYAGAADRVKVALDGSIVAEGDALGDTFSSIARLIGTGSSDVMFGDANGNVINGGSSNDTIRGQAGDDLLRGDTGGDNMSGGAGDDRFSYLALNQGGDTINDFSNGAGNNDVFNFKGSVYGGLAAGALAANRFVTNTTGLATTANHRFIYETDTGILRFDSNGTGAGGASVIATLTGAPALALADFVIV